MATKEPKKYEYHYDVYNSEEEAFKDCDGKNHSGRRFMSTDYPDMFDPEHEDGEYSEINLEMLADECAQYYWDSGGQECWEQNEELVFVLFYEGKLLGRVSSILEMVPSYNSAVINKPLEKEEVDNGQTN